MASTYLTRTEGTATSRRKFTISAWIKKCAVPGSEQHFYNSFLSSQYRFMVYFNSSEQLQVRNVDNNSANANYITTRVFRDTNSFYHIVVEVDTTQATASDRIKIYVNGVEETDFGTETDPSQNTDLSLGSSSYTTNIGRYGGGSNNFDGSMSHYHFIDGTAYDADTFGETDSTTGEWKPNSSPSVTYGTNGFFLKFENASSFGEDLSGNDNDFTSNGSPTQLVDTPTNVLATFNSLSKNDAGTVTFSDCNSTTAHTGTDSRYTSYSTLGALQGKWYAEFKIINSSNPDVMVGVGYEQTIENQNSSGGYLGEVTGTYGYFTADGQKYVEGTQSSYGDSCADGDIIGVALDLDNNYLYFSKNGTWQNSGDPTSGATGTGGIAITADKTYFIACGHATTSARTSTYSANFGNGYFGTTAVTSGNQDDAGYGTFEYDVPTGYYTLNTKNINTYG